MSEPGYRYLRCRLDRGVLLLTVTEPELHAGVADALLGEWARAVDDAGVRQVVLDCGHIRSLTSAGIGALVAFRRRLRQQGGFLLLCRVAPKVAEVLFAAHRSGSSSSSKIPFGLAPDVASAVAYLTGAGWGSYRVQPVAVGEEHGPPAGVPHP